MKQKTLSTNHTSRKSPKRAAAKAGLIGAFLLAAVLGSAQEIKVPDFPGTGHPRLLTSNSEKASLLAQLAANPQIREHYQTIRKNIDAYVDRHQADSTWIVSRLQLYWKTKASEVYVKGPVYSHASGQAPVPTVRFTGARDATSNYTAPKLEDILPYMDDPRGLYLLNRTTNTLEWTDPAKAGRVVESINRSLLNMAQSAAFVYWLTGEEKYAQFAFDLFDTYMTGMYYRKEPVDLSHSHIQTLVGLSSFEVIHEDILTELAPTYDFLYAYIQKKAPQKLSLYADTFKKWADLIIRNGVPFNNWNLFEARFISLIAMVLEADKDYKDGRGMQYYLDQILNKDATRQWAFTTLVKKGFDPKTALWSECPGYSVNVVGDFTGFVQLFDRLLHFDLLQQVPLIEKSVLATAQYLYPNGYTVGFGDTHYGRLSTAPAEQLVQNAQKNNKPAQEERFTGFVKMIEALNRQTAGYGGTAAGGHGGGGLNALLNRSAFSLKASIPAGRLEDFVSPTFYAPNVSYFVQRNGLDPVNGLMISQAGSEGNHAHANGIAMELFGKGVALAPEMGIGTSYFQPDYAEYYSQFPAHNTVVVDGISAYPTMKSHHGFTVKSCYPAPEMKKGIFPSVTFSDLYFLEPETNADQDRTMSIIRTSDYTGYYVDVFRSRRKEGGDKRHDYFYHNLGQQLEVTAADGSALALQPTDKPAFADGDLFAYDYLWDRRSVKTAKDISATYRLNVPGREEVRMHVWMKGVGGRELFTVKAPPSKAFRHDAMIPDSIASLPIHTLMARQTGEAWSRPFVAVYEPSSGNTPPSIRSISPLVFANAAGVEGIRVEGVRGDRQYIFSGDGRGGAVYGDKAFTGTYAVIHEEKDGKGYLFLGNGEKLASGGYALAAKAGSVAATLDRTAEGIFVAASRPVTLTLPAEALGKKTVIRLTAEGKQLSLTGKKGTRNGKAVLSFELPALPYIKILN
ncbi:heparinase II/III family protein [Paraflavisolibacter sp. H34]|uniref:heparinase II/III domain-containing protein n=1 Tax=Huijunlia imazamoxiresistens TaxID=3127457 RepID=UPI0030179A88